MDALKVNGLRKAFDKFTLDRVSFALEEGTITGFIGENGAGKTTTMKLIAGLTHKDGGEVAIFGKEQEDLTKADREKYSIVFDEPTFPDKVRLTRLNDILDDLFLDWDSGKFFSYLESFGIDKTKRINELSNGMKGKLNIAIALSHGSRLLILDEPANGLDPMARDDFLGILASFVRDKRGTVLISSHIVSDLEKICSRFIFIHRGRILFDDSKANLMSRYELISLPSAKKDLALREGIISKRDNPLTGELEVLAKAGTFEDLGLKAKSPSLEELAIMLIKSDSLSPKAKDSL